MKRLRATDPKTGEAYKTPKIQRERAQTYYHDHKNAQGGYRQRSIGATLNAPEAESITAIFKAHGIKPAEAFRATAEALTAGTATAEAIKQAAQAWTERHKATTTTTEDGNEQQASQAGQAEPSRTRAPVRIM